MEEEIHEIWVGSWFSLYSDGTLGHHDGFEYMGETHADEVRDFYEFLKEFYKESEK